MEHPQSHHLRLVGDPPVGLWHRLGDAGSCPAGVENQRDIGGRYIGQRRKREGGRWKGTEIGDGQS
jgi:hypothetical protein